MISLSDSQLAEFNSTIPWYTGMRLPDGRILGNPSRLFEKSHTQPMLDSSVEHLNLNKDMTAIELGCCEGVHSVWIAPYVKHLTCVEVRPRNVVGLLTQLFIHEISNATVRIQDVSVMDSSAESYDILFHRGLLYHFSNPIQHLFSLKGLSKRIVLSTIIGTESQRATSPLREFEYEGQRYPCVYYNEAGWSDAWSGVDNHSVWLMLDTLMDILGQIGYRRLKVVEEYKAGTFPVVTIVGSMD